MKKIIILLALLIIPKSISAQFVRQNEFHDKVGAERIAQIKKFQARMNLNVTGVLDSATNKSIYTENYEVFDNVKNPPTKGVWIAINKSKRILTVYEGNKSIGKFPVTLGKSSSQTPSTKAKIQNKHKNPSWGGMGGRYRPISGSSASNPLGRRWMGLKVAGKHGYGIHGNIKPHQIGGYYSSGCIRMYNYDIENYVFPIMKVGAPVWIGTDAELNSWGVEQISRISTKKQMPQQNPVEKPNKEEVKPEETKKLDGEIKNEPETKKPEETEQEVKKQDIKTADLFEL